MNADYGTNGKTAIARTITFGDLSGVISTTSHAPFEMKLTADTGFKVSLASFDLAGSPSHDWTIKSVQIVDGNNNSLYSASNVVIQGDSTGARHTHIAFTTPLTASVIKIRFDASNLAGSAAVGLDNVQFSQVKLATISGNVFNDVNKDGVKAASGEPGLSGWRVYLDKNNDGIFQSTETSVLSDVNGNYNFSVLPGSYHVAEVLQTGWQRTSPTGSYAITATAGQKFTGKNFGNAKIPPLPATISGNVFNDINRDGVKAATGEPGLSGWRVFLDTNNDGVFQNTEKSVLSDATGNYSFSVAAGSYHVAEVLQTGWQRTAPAGSYAITATAGQKITGKNFGDAQIVTDPVISVGNYTAAAGSQVSIQLKVSDLGNVTAQDIEGMTFTVQIESGDGTAPTIASVDLLTGTVWAGHGSSVFVPSGGSQPQFKTFSVLTGADGNFINPNGLLATIVLDTSGTAKGQYAIKLIGTKISAFDTEFQNHLGTPVKSVITNGTLTLT